MKEWREYNPHFICSIKVSRVWSCKVVSVWRKRSSRIRWASVLRPKTSKSLFRPVNIFSFYLLELYKNKCRNLIQTSKFKYSFRGVGQLGCKMPHSFQVLTWLSWIIEWYHKYLMSIVISKSSLPEIILIFSLKIWDIHVYALTWKSL